MTDREVLEWQAARGALAAGVAAELAAPLERVHAMLATTVERLDRHVATSRGPDALPAKAVGEVRERVAEVFLEIGRVRRLAGSLAALALTAGAQEIDLNEVVERGLNLARHRFAVDCDATLDLAALPPVRADPARLAQAVALLVAAAADAAGPDGTVAVTTGVGAGVTVTISGSFAAAAEAVIAAAALADDGGRLEVGEAGVTLTFPRAPGLS